MEHDNIITENKVVVNICGEVEFLLTKESEELGYFSTEEGKRLIAEIIKQA